MCDVNSINVNIRYSNHLALLFDKVLREEGKKVINFVFNMCQCLPNIKRDVTQSIHKLPSCSQGFEIKDLMT